MSQTLINDSHDYSATFFYIFSLFSSKNCRLSSSLPPISLSVVFCVHWKIINEARGAPRGVDMKNHKWREKRVKIWNITKISFSLFSSLRWHKTKMKTWSFFFPTCRHRKKSSPFCVSTNICVWLYKLPLNVSTWNFILWKVFLLFFRTHKTKKTVKTVENEQVSCYEALCMSRGMC